MENTQTLDFELLSEDVKDILTTPPKWMIRWGISIVLSIVILIFLTSWFIKYSDTIAASISITTEIPPISITSPVGGRIAQIYVKNNQFVEINSPLLLLENTANLNDVLAIKKQIANLKSYNDIDKNLSYCLLSGDNSYSLGELQSLYSSLKNQIDSYRFFINTNTSQNKVALLNQKRNQIEILVENQRKLLILKEKEKLNSKNKLDSHRKLYEQKVISLLEFNQIEADFFAKEFEIDNINSSIIRNNIEMNEIGGQIVEQTFGVNNQVNDSKVKLVEQVNVLYAQILEWEKKYLIKSPSSGKISFLKIWKANQIATSGQELLKVVPENDKIIVKGTVSSEGVGKIKTGQKAIIKVEAYPFEEFGTLDATISNVSLVPQDDKFYVEFILTNNLTTSYHKVISLKQEMKASAEIITHKRNLLERLFDKVIGKMI